MQLAPCVLAREQLQQLLAGGVDRRCNAVSARMDTVTGWWCRNCQRTGERAQVQRLLTRGLPASSPIWLVEPVSHRLSVRP